MKREFVDNDEIKIIVNEIGEDERAIEVLKKDYPFKIEKLEEDLLDYIGEKDLNFLKREYPANKWKFLTKEFAHPYKYFNSLEYYQEPVDSLKKEDFLSKLKNDYPSIVEIVRTKKLIERFDIRNGEVLTKLYCKTDDNLLTCVFKKIIKVIINELANNPLFCVSLSGYTWPCVLKYTGVNNQTLQDKNMTLFLENNNREGISSVMGDRNGKSDDNKKIIYVDATKFMDGQYLSHYHMIKFNLMKMFV